MTTAAEKGAEFLRRARDLMGRRSGARWIKGDTKAMINPAKHKPGNEAEYLDDETGFEPAYCSIGALQEVGANDHAIIALGDILDPDTMDGARERGKSYGYNAAEMRNHLTGIATSIIIDNNDDRDTNWEDVGPAFTKAADKLIRE